MAVTGRVEKFVEINPERIRLMGKAGETLATEVEIAPRKDYPFTIERMEAQDGTFIKYELKEKCTAGRGRCVIRVEYTKADKGRYMDRIVIHTDSLLSPVISIIVNDRIL